MKILDFVSGPRETLTLKQEEGRAYPGLISNSLPDTRSYHIRSFNHEYIQDKGGEAKLLEDISANHNANAVLQRYAKAGLGEKAMTSLVVALHKLVDAGSDKKDFANLEKLWDPKRADSLSVLYYLHNDTVRSQGILTKQFSPTKNDFAKDIADAIKDSGDTYRIHPVTTYVNAYDHFIAKADLSKEPARALFTLFKKALVNQAKNDLRTVNLTEAFVKLSKLADNKEVMNSLKEMVENRVKRDLFLGNPVESFTRIALNHDKDADNQAAHLKLFVKVATTNYASTRKNMVRENRLLRELAGKLSASYPHNRIDSSRNLNKIAEQVSVNGPLATASLVNDLADIAEAVNKSRIAEDRDQVFASFIQERAKAINEGMPSSVINGYFEQALEDAQDYDSFQKTFADKVSLNTDKFKGKGVLLPRTQLGLVKLAA